MAQSDQIRRSHRVARFRTRVRVRPPDGGNQHRGDTARLAAVGLRKNDGVLVAAEAGDGVGAAQTVRQDVGDGRDGPVNADAGVLAGELATAALVDRVGLAASRAIVVVAVGAGSVGTGAAKLVMPGRRPPGGSRSRPACACYLICTPLMARLMIRRWISEVPSKMV